MGETRGRAACCLSLTVARLYRRYRDELLERLRLGGEPHFMRHDSSKTADHEKPLVMMISMRERKNNTDDKQLYTRKKSG